ncbi:MAG: hypothetical protein L3J19_01430 [Sulfurimonas sp.]|nr:hypothetical protein [Sulfurimonas sp.]
MNIDYKKTSKTLNSRKIIFNENDSLLIIGKNDNISSSYIYQIINRSDSTKKHIDISPSLGKKTLQDLSDLKKIDLGKSITFLKAKGFIDVSADMRIKEIANELNIMPIDVYKMLKNEA